MSNKLFQKMRDQIEINSIKNDDQPLTEAQKAEVEKKIIFEDVNIERINTLNIVNSEESK